MSRNSDFLKVAMIAVLLSSVVACQKKVAADATGSAEGSSERFLYISSGGCYVGTLTAESASRTVARVNLSTGNIDSTVVDYNSASPGDTPVGLVHADASSLYVAIENSSGRRIDKVSKSDGSFQTYISNSTALSAQLRGIIRSSDGGFFVSKTSAIEKFSPSKSRVLSGANPWVNNPAGSCTTSTSIINMLELPNGNIAYINAAASQNRIGIITGATGYVAAADCKAVMASPNANAYPTAIVYIAASKQFLVSYASSTAGYDYIYAYDFDETTNVISGATLAYNNTSVIRGVSAMYYDTTDGVLYVANGSTALANSIEKFSFNSSTKTLTRLGTASFSMPTINHKCISSMNIY